MGDPVNGGGSLSWDDVFKQAVSEGLKALGAGVSKIFGGGSGSNAPTVKVDIGGISKILIVAAVIVGAIVLLLKKG